MCCHSFDSGMCKTLTILNLSLKLQIELHVALTQLVVRPAFKLACSALGIY